MFSCDICGIFKNTFFEEPLRAAASGFNIGNNDNNVDNSNNYHNGRDWIKRSFKERRGYCKKCIFPNSEDRWEVTVFKLHHFLSGFETMKPSYLKFFTDMRKVHFYRYECRWKYVYNNRNILNFLKTHGAIKASKVYIRDHSISTLAKFSKKLTFLTYVCLSGGKKC